MIITTLFGGLGNQMFHYAIARNFYERKPQRLLLDTYHLQDEEDDIEKIVQRPFALSIFNNLKAEIASETLTAVLHDNDFLNKVKRKIFLLFTTIIKQKQMEEVELPLSKKIKHNLLLIGNFQSQSYFKNIRSELLNDFQFPKLDEANEKLRRLMLSTPNSISIHVRRGDYLSSSNKKIFTSVNLNYYNHAIDILKRMLEINQLKVFVFTDDIDWVKNNFTQTNELEITYISGNTSKNSWKDMALMTACKHHIIANSSFSWWGAWLSSNNGITIAPRHWFLPNSYSFDINNIIPETWIVADYKLDAA